jgi:hypothetical protein
LIEVETKAIGYCLSMIYPENRYPLFRIML